MHFTDKVAANLLSIFLTYEMNIIIQLRQCFKSKLFSENILRLKELYKQGIHRRHGKKIKLNFTNCYSSARKSLGL